MKLSIARRSLLSQGSVPADVAGSLKESALKLALELKIRVTHAIRILKDIEPGLGAVCPVGVQDLLDGSDPYWFWKEVNQLCGRCIKFRDRFVESNLRLVVSEVAKISRYGLSKFDMIQVGNIGLIKAAESFDERRKFRFTSFAVPVIRSEVNRAHSNTGRLIRLPVYQCESLAKLEGVRKRLEQSSVNMPRVSELALESGLPESTVEELSVWRKPILSLDAPLGGESDLTLADTLVDPSSLPTDAETAGLIELVDRGLKALPPVERQLLSMRHGLEGDPPNGIKTAAERLGLSVAIAQALETKAVEHLRRSIRKGQAGFEWNEQPV
jgi:RNA polymerase sigma factor (sigma-70 family)